MWDNTKEKRETIGVDTHCHTMHKDQGKRKPTVDNQNVDICRENLTALKKEI